MSKFWKATSVNATNGSAIVTVNTGDDVALIRANSLLQIGALQVVEVKTVNTSNQTIELFDAWNGGSISGQSAIAAPSAAELAQAIDDVRTLTAAYEGIADDVSVNPTANSIVKRTSAGRVKTATPSAADDAVNISYFQSDSALNAAGIYHTGNANFNEFGGNSVNDNLVQGFALNATTAIFYLPINSRNVPASVTVSGGSLKLVDFITSTVRASGISSLNLSSSSSTRLAVVTVAASGMTAGDIIMAQPESATSKITVNF